MNNVTALAVMEPIRVDGRRVSDIVTELGEVAAENVIGHALEQLATGLGHIRRAALDGDRAGVLREAMLVSRLAWQVGLVSLSGVAVDVAACVESRDDVAMHATVARLLRVGNHSLTAIWEEPTHAG